MTNKVLIYLFLLLGVFSYSQETINISFKVKSILKIKPRAYQPKTKDTLLINSLRADVKTKYGDFSLLLIDINKNNNFNDFRTRGSKIGSDAIKIIDYKSNDIIILKHQIRPLKRDYPIVFNGHSFRVANLKKENTNTYTALLVEKKVILNEVLKNRNGVLIDNLPTNLLIDLNKTTKKYKIKEKLDLNKYFLMKFYTNQNHYINFSEDWSKYKDLQKLNLKILFLGVKKEDKYISSCVGDVYFSADLDFIDATNLENLMKLGYSSDSPYAILFDNKGKVVKSGIDYQQLVSFLKEKQRIKTAAIK